MFEGTGAPAEFLVQAGAAIGDRCCSLPLFVEQMAVHLRQVGCDLTGVQAGLLPPVLEPCVQIAMLRPIPCLDVAGGDRQGGQSGPWQP